LTPKNRIAVIQILHTTAVAIGATFLALGFVFYGLQFSYIMAVMGKMTSEEIVKSGGAFFNLSYIFLGIGLTIIIGATVIAYWRIKKLKLEKNNNEKPKLIRSE